MKQNTATIKKTRSGTFNFTLYAANGEVVAHSVQGYEKKSEAKRILRKYFPNFTTVGEQKKQQKAVAKLHTKLARARR